MSDHPLLASAMALQEKMSADRRHFHMHPELGFLEHETAEFVVTRLREIGIDDIQTGIAETGIIAQVIGTAEGPGRCVLLRADMDALPITEENDVPYRSQNPGVMHACGHDGHTAMLLAIGTLLHERRHQFSGTVKLCFQPSEEAHQGGALPMIQSGVLENPHVDAVFGQHVGSEIPAPMIGVRGGPTQASTDSIRIVVQGKGGHGAMPNMSVDTILIGAEIIGALQSVASRSFDPLHPVVVTIGSFHGGTAGNIIPDRAEMVGTVRVMHESDRDLAEQRITAIAQGIAAAYGGSAEVVYHRGYPPTVNDVRMAEFARQAAINVVGVDHVFEPEPMMPAEDFSYFLQERPGAYLNLGTRNEEAGIVWPHHHPRFDMDESAFPYGVAVLAQTALDFLTAESDPLEGTHA